MNIDVIIVLVVLTALFILRAPVGLSMICVGVLYFLMNGLRLGSIPEIIMSSFQGSLTLVAIPLFIFTANIMDTGKVTEYMFTFSKALVGRKRGAMAYINIILSLIFSGMTGSAAADVSGIGIIELSEMKKDGYDKAFSGAITAATATVGPIFPPSIPMVIYAMIAGVSVGKLFLGGMIPAILICVSLGVYVWYISKKRNYPTGVKFTTKQFLVYTFKALPALLTPVILLGGIYSGIVTATEAGALAAVYTLIISTFVYKAIRLKGLINAFKKTIIQTGIVFGIIAGAYVMTFIVAHSGIGNSISDWFLGITNNKFVFLLVINIALLVLGMLFDTMVLQLIFIPLIIPVARALGIDMVHFGVVCVVNMMIGLSTPPYGMLCYIVSGLAEESLGKIFKEVIPMVLIMIVVLIIITYVPQTITWIPSLLK